MVYPAHLEASELSNLNKVARWLIQLRWIAATGVVVVLVAARVWYPVPLPYIALFALVAVLLALNGVYQRWFTRVKSGTLTRSDLVVFFQLQVFVDYILLTLLLYFSGFLENPFLYFFVFHILLTAYLLPARLVFLFIVSLVSLLTGLSVLEYLRVVPHFPLYTALEPGYNAQIVPRLAGFCATLAISGYMGTSIKKRLDDKAHKVEIELEKYKSLDKVKSNFILQVTHELRGPLAAVVGYHEMISRGITGPVEPKTAEVLGRATRRTESLLTMIDEMIDYAYMQTDDKLRFGLSMISLKEAIDANCDAQAGPAEAKGIRFEVKCANGLAVRANRDLLNIILTNLLSNAVRYSPADSLVSIVAEREGREICLAVADRGIGMSAEELGHIFEEFYRTRRAREVERDGTGLGLSIIKKTVDVLGGRIVVTSEVNKGSTFTIYLPEGEADELQDTDH